MPVVVSLDRAAHRLRALDFLPQRADTGSLPHPLRFAQMRVSAPMHSNGAIGAFRLNPSSFPYQLARGLFMVSPSKHKKAESEETNTCGTIYVISASLINSTDHRCAREITGSDTDDLPNLIASSVTSQPRLQESSLPVFAHPQFRAAAFQTLPPRQTYLHGSAR